MAMSSSSVQRSWNSSSMVHDGRLVKAKVWTNWLPPLRILKDWLVKYTLNEEFLAFFGS